MDDRQQVIRELTWTFDSGDLKTSIFARKQMHLFYTLFKKKTVHANTECRVNILVETPKQF